MGPLFGTYLYQSLERMTFLLTGLSFALFTIVLMVQYTKDQTDRSSSRSKQPVRLADCVRMIRRDDALFYYVLGGILFFSIYAQLEASLPIYLSKSLGSQQLFPVLLTLNASIVICFQSFVSKWAENKSPLSCIVLSSFLFFFGYASFAFRLQPCFYIGIILLTFGEILVFPIINKLIDQLADDRFRGTYYGAGNLAQVGLFLGPLAGGWIQEYMNGADMWWIIAVASLYMIWFYAMGYRKYMKRYEVGVMDIIYRMLRDLKLLPLLKGTFKAIPFVSFLLALLIWLFHEYQISQYLIESGTPIIRSSF
jgi:predicted MFS family arabinose efflux permease